jgi:hypothetical protein
MIGKIIPFSGIFLSLSLEDSSILYADQEKSITNGILFIVSILPHLSTATSSHQIALGYVHHDNSHRVNSTISSHLEISHPSCFQVLNSSSFQVALNFLNSLCNLDLLFIQLYHPG